MKPFEFVLVIVSVIIGLALTEAAMGVAYMIKIYKTAHFYWPYFTICALGFMTCLNYWGTVYKLRRVTSWTVPGIGVVFMTGLLFFVMTKIVFPDPEGFDQDYERYYNDNIGIILLLTILFLCSYMFESFMLRKIRTLKRYWMAIVFIAVTSTGLIIENTSYRAVLSVIMLIMNLYYMYATRVIIGDKQE